MKQRTETKRGKIDHETLILHDLKEILKNIFDLKRFDKRTISRSDITYDSFITINRLKPGLKGYEFFEFLFEKKVLIVEVKTPGQYFDLQVMAQIEDIQASYLGDLRRKQKLKEEELEQIIVLTVVTSVSKKFINRCRKKEILIKSVKGKKGLYILHRLIPIYIIVIDELAYDESYVQLLKYMKDLKRLLLLINKMKDGLKKEKFIKILTSFIDYNPELLTEGRVKEMIPVFREEKDRTEYIDKFLKGFGAENVLSRVNPKKRLEGLKVKDRLEGLKVKDRLEGLKVKDRLEGLNKNDREKLKKILMEN